MGCPQPGQKAAVAGILAAHCGHASGVGATESIEAHLIKSRALRQTA